MTGSKKAKPEADEQFHWFYGDPDCPNAHNHRRAYNDANVEGCREEKDCGCRICTSCRRKVSFCYTHSDAC
jgi:hypothetical protein